MTDNRLFPENMPWWVLAVFGGACSASLIAGRRLERAMTLSEIERLAALANRACAAVIERPGDKADRQSLFDALSPLVSPAFIDGHDPQPPQVRALLRQTAVLAEIMRSRVVYSQTGKRSDDFEAMHIGNGAREVRRVLSALIDAIGTGTNV